MKQQLLILTAILSLTLFGCSKTSKTILQKPNIIFVLVDDFGYSQIAYISDSISEKDYDPLFLKYTLETGNYDPKEALDFSRKATPTLSRMAKEGVMFTNAFAPSNLCAPSRIAIATGIKPARRGIYRNIDCESLGPEPGSLLAEKLHNSGYATAHIGKWHIGSRDQLMVNELMKKHGIKDSVGVFPPLAKLPEIREELVRKGYLGSCTPEHHPLNNGFDYYYGYNMYESPFYNATNVWEGFEHVPPNQEYNTDLFTDKAIGFIKQIIEQKKPFFVQLHFHAVHAPLDPKAPDKFSNRFNSESFILNNFYAHVFAVDENVRRLEIFLKEKGVAENTIIVFTSDNGGSIGGRSTMPGNAPYRGHKGMYFMGGLKVPLFFSWPAGIVQPEKNMQLVSTLDILPTVLEAAGIHPPPNIDGKSLLRYLKNESDEPVHDHLIWSGIHARAWGFMSNSAINPPLVSRERAPAAWSVIKDGYILRFISKTEPGLYKEIPEGKPATFELYNYITDPGERIDLIEKQHDKVKELLQIWEKESGSFPPPVKWRRDRWEELMNSANDYKQN